MFIISQTAQGLGINPIPFFIPEPPPFIEIQDRGFDVLIQKVELLIGGFTVGMVDLGLGVVSCFEFRPNTPAEVGVFHIQEKPFIKVAHILKGLSAQKHERTGEEGGGHARIVVGKPQLINHIPFLEPG